MTVGVKTEREFAFELFLNVITILLCLFTANCRIFGSFFGFYNSKRFGISAQQNVIAKLVALIGGKGLTYPFRQTDIDIKLLYNLRAVSNIPPCGLEFFVDYFFSGVVFGFHKKLRGVSGCFPICPTETLAQPMLHFPTK